MEFTGPPSWGSLILSWIRRLGFESWVCCCRGGRPRSKDLIFLTLLSSSREETVAPPCKVAGMKEKPLAQHRGSSPLSGTCCQGDYSNLSLRGSWALTATGKRMRWEHLLTPCTKINSKWIKDLSVRPESIKLLDQNIGRTPSDINPISTFLDLFPKAKEIKARINK